LDAHKGFRQQKKPSGWRASNLPGRFYVKTYRENSLSLARLLQYQ
jgi:hypothetical protein